MNYILFAFIFLLSMNVFAVSIEGKWKSDKELTLEFNNSSAILDPEQRFFFDQLMGHMIVEYKDGIAKLSMPTISMITEGKTSDFQGFTEESTYKVIGSDDNTIVIETKDSDGLKLIITYHFEDEDTMWVYVAGQSSLFPHLNIREYFVRYK